MSAGDSIDVSHLLEDFTGSTVEAIVERCTAAGFETAGAGGDDVNVEFETCEEVGN